jgi:hypothetical protein
MKELSSTWITKAMASRPCHPKEKLVKDQTNNGIKPVLIVLTSNPVKGESGIPTGFWLSELTHPLAKTPCRFLCKEEAWQRGVLRR